MQGDYIDEHGLPKRFDSCDHHDFYDNDHQHPFIRYALMAGFCIFVIMSAGTLGIGLAQISIWIGRLL